MNDLHNIFPPDQAVLTWDFFGRSAVVICTHKRPKNFPEMLPWVLPTGGFHLLLNHKVILFRPEQSFPPITYFSDDDTTSIEERFSHCRCRHHSAPGSICRQRSKR
jgi:hypothetical protein